VDNRSTVTVRRRNVRKAVGSLGVIGAAAAVAGMGTFGTFTGSTTPVDTNVDTGVVSIALNPAVNYASVPFTPGGLLPGDTVQQPFDLVNNGNVPWSSVTLDSAAVASSLLDTDQVNGLQFTVQDCPQSWTVVGTGYTCAGGATSFYSGPVIMSRALPGAVSLSPGGTDHLLATVAFPQTAGNGLSGQTSRLTFTFTAVQRAGSAR
jgi:hypothetical protein